jgi:hypothetical protein
MSTLDGFCTKCRSMRPMAKIEKTNTKKGRPAHKGVCGICGQKMYRMGGK